MAGFVNLLKLSVGTSSVEDLADWHDSQRHRWPEGCTVHVTRMWPRREAEILAGGSIYWVIKGVIQARQQIVGLESVNGADGVPHCALILKAGLIRTTPAPRRPFQGWRYLAPADSPPDLPEGRSAQALPPELSAALSDLGLL
jgi:hypothetical protein